MRIALPLRLGRTGSLLVITLWLVTILSALAIAIGRFLSLEVKLTKYRLQREQANVLARSGVYLAMRRLQLDAQQPGEVDWLGDAWALPWNDVAVGENRIRIVSIVDEERKLNLNAVDMLQLPSELASLIGTGPVASTLVDYLNPIPPPGGLPPSTPYLLKHGPVAALEELFDLPGVSDVFPRLRQLTSTLPHATPPPKVNINTVERDVLVALGGIPAVVDALIASRPGLTDGKFGTSDDCYLTRFSDVAQAAHDLSACAQIPSAMLLPLLSLPTATFVVNSSTFRIQVEGVVGPQPIRHHLEAVIQRTPQGEHIVAWRDG